MLKNFLKRFSLKKVIVITIVLLVSLSMIPWVITNYSLSSQGSSDKWVTVGNKTTSSNVILGEYNAFIQQNYQYVSQNPYALFQYLNNLISQHVMVLLFANEAEALNLQIDNDLLLKIVAEIPAFQTSEGKFDRAKFTNRIVSIFGSETIFLDNIKNNLLKEQLVNSIGSNIHLSYYASYVEMMALKQVRNIKYIDINSLIKIKTSKPQLKDLKKLRDDNKKLFTTEPSRNGEYIYVRTQDILPKIKITPAEIKNYYNAHTANYMTNEKRNILQINFTLEKDAKDAFAKIPKMQLAEIKKNYKIIELNNVEANSLPNQLSASAFSIKKGTWTGPVSSDLGWHILMVNNIISPSVKKLVAVSSEIQAEITATKKKTILDDIQSQLSALSVNDSLAKLAKKLQASYYSFNNVNDKNINSHKDIIKNEDIFATILETKAKSHSEVIETNNGDLFMVRINQINPAKLQSIKTIKPQLIAMWNKQQKETQIATKTTDILVALAKGTNISSLGYPIKNIKISRETKDSTFTEASLENLLVSALNKPVEGKLANGNTFISLTTSIVNSKLKYKNASSIKNQQVVNLAEYLTQQYTQAFFEFYAKNLQNKYKVKINEKAIMEKLAPNQ